jgi:hypothetical protein
MIAAFKAHLSLYGIVEFQRELFLQEIGHAAK